MSRTSPVFNLRMPPEIKEKITAQAEANKRSINAEIVAAVELSLAVNGGTVEPTDSGLPGGFGHLLKFYKAEELEKLVNDISMAAAERAIKKLSAPSEK
ncbi:Arc family DNA-binding protein [Pectobacterium carotovorum]|uniref:Arc family DNA-binding protein n=1 Tax=Pectobacterium carotovorum TaxID=554 RepID=UPI001CF53B9E|nr:Arc family DNA-binding protein [Pectobacterium carotovorum]MCA6971223.1 Arc family DNA-binding protein [Pectobacterium carotovorum]